MNLLDAYVKDVLSEPYEAEFGGWFVDVTYLCWSSIPEKRQMWFRTKEEAAQVESGYHFLT